MGSRRLYFTQPALLDQAFRRPGFRGVAQVLGHHQGDPGLVGGPDHLPAFLQVLRHRLLGERVLAGFGGRNGLRRVVPVTRADVHGVDVRVAEHLVVVGVDGLHAGLLRVLLRKRSDDVAHGGEPHPVRIPEIGIHVAVGDPARADEADFQWFRHVLPFHVSWPQP